MTTKIDREWKEELKNPPSKELEYRAEKDVAKYDERVENLAVSLLNIPGLDEEHPNNKYNNEQKVRAVVAYFIYGSTTKAAEIAGVPDYTLRGWKRHTSWWNNAIREVKRAKQEQLDAKLTNLIEKSMSELRDRLMNGDEVVTAKGARVRRKIGGRDLAIITGTLYDKRTAIRKDPLNELEQKKDDTLSHLKKDFEKLSNEIRAKNIDGEHEIIKQEDIQDANYEESNHQTSKEIQQKEKE